MGFKWVNPVHEILEYEKEEKQTFTDELIIDHSPVSVEPVSKT